MSIWEMSHEEIVDAINYVSIDPEELLDQDAWWLICYVRGRNLDSVWPSSWQDLCRVRAQARYEW